MAQKKKKEKRKKVLKALCSLLVDGKMPVVTAAGLAGRLENIFHVLLR